MDNKYDVLIVGTGAAGLFAALHLPDDYRILLITKDELENSDSYLAQGGICCLLGPDDFNSFYEDTMRAGHYENRPESVRNMIENSQKIIRELVGDGVDFDQNPDGSMNFTREGGHSTFRILHHEDVTGKEIVTKLIERVKERDNIEIRTFTTMVDLIESDNTVHGAVLRDADGNDMPVFADAVILATGGLGGLFRHSTNFRHITGDSFAIALRHGIQLENIHYIQIHPTVLYSNKPGRSFLISESVRGEGAKLLNENKEWFTDELQPRDVVSNAIRLEMKKFDTDHVYMTFEDVPDEQILHHFPNIYQHCLEEGYDIIKGDLIPITPAQHYLMGGIHANHLGQTTMKNLYAVGETACNGVHGANRLASNSLLESLVFSENAAKLIAQTPKEEWHGADSWKMPSYPDTETMKRENRKLVRDEIGKQGAEFYEKWSNI